MTNQREVTAMKRPKSIQKILRGSLLNPGDRGLRRDVDISISEHGSIVDVERSGRHESRPDVPVHDWGHFVILPGLIDMHAHTVVPTASECDHLDDVRSLQTIRGVENLTRAVRSGITTVRDAGSLPHIAHSLRTALDDGRILGPDLILSGAAITTTGGHCWDSIGRAADGPLGMITLVREQVKMGAEWIKLMITGGAGTESVGMTEVQMREDEISAAVQEARLHGKKVMAHVTSAEGAALGIRYGVDTLEHCVTLDSAVAQSISASNIPVCATLSIYRRMADRVDLYDRDAASRAQAHVQAHSDSIRKLIDSSASVLVGTDSGGHHWPMGDLVDELEALHSLGMSEESVIVAATRTAALVLGKENLIGAVGPGMQADLIVVNGNPLENLDALRNIEAVYKHGYQINPLDEAMI